MNANFATDAIDLTEALQAIVGEGFSVRRIDGRQEARAVINQIDAYNRELKNQAFYMAQTALGRNGSFLLEAVTALFQTASTEYLRDVNGYVHSYFRAATPNRVESVLPHYASPIYVILPPALPPLHMGPSLPAELSMRGVSSFHFYKEEGGRLALVIGQADAYDLCVSGNPSENPHLIEWQSEQRNLIAGTLASYREYCETPSLIRRVANCIWPRAAKASPVPA